jgi:hypothetical protein
VVLRTYFHVKAGEISGDKNIAGQRRNVSGAAERLFFFFELLVAS